MKRLLPPAPMAGHDALRRKVLRCGAAGAALWAAGTLPPRLYAKPSELAAPDLVSTALSDKLHLIQGAGGNVLACTSADGVLVVDGGLEANAQALHAKIAQLSGGAKVQVLFNTHWHWDHIGANALLAREGSQIIAHENTRQWLMRRIECSWEHRSYAPQPAAALPTRTFFAGPQTQSFSGQTIEYVVLPQAHTDGDIYVFFPRENVLAAGGVVSGGSYPLTDYCTGGWLGGMIDGLKTLLAKSDAQTRIISGEGAVRTRADIQAQLDMCTAVLAKIGTSYFKGESWQQLRDANPTREFDAQWGNPQPFLQAAYDGAWYHVNEIRRYAR